MVGHLAKGNASLVWFSLRSRRHDLLPCLRADRWPNDDVYRLLKGLTRLHNEKRMKEAFTDNNIKHQKNYLKGIP